MKIIKWILFFANVVAAVLLLLSFIVPLYDVDVIWPLPVVALSFPLLLFVNVVFILLWLLIDFRYLFLSLLAIVVNWSQFTSFVQFNIPKESKDQIGLLTYNISQGQYYSNQNDKISVDLNNITDYIKSQDVDVVCIQEGSPAIVEFFKKELSGFSEVFLDGKRAIIFSKYPVVDSGNLEFGTTITSAIWADIKKGDIIIRVYNVHLSSNRVTRTSNDFINNNDIQERETWSKLRKMLHNYRVGAIQRMAQAKIVKAHLDESPYPSILAGDFNDIPQSRVYAFLTTGMKDAFNESGVGIGTTYRGSIPFLRIDNVMVTKEFDVLSHKIDKIKLSDHFPVLVQMQYKY